MSFTLAIGSRMRLAPASKATCKRLGQVLDRDDVSAQAHAAQDDHLLLERLAQDARAEGDEGRQRHGRRRPGVVQLDDVQVVVVVARLDRGADPAGVRLEVVEPDLDRLLGRRSSSRGPTSSGSRCPHVTWVSSR